MDEKLQKIADDFLARISQKLPSTKPVQLFVVATIGLPGSGRTTVAKRLVQNLTGTVLVQSNSARHLLKEAGLPWGENVRQVLKQVATQLLPQGYGVVFDGNAADEEDRRNIQEIADSSGAKVLYVRINIDPEVAKARERTKYDDLKWVSGFEDFRVNTTEKMLQNIDRRAELHQNLKSGNIPDLVGEIDNNNDLGALEKQADEIAEKIKANL